MHTDEIAQAHGVGQSGLQSRISPGRLNSFLDLQPMPMPQRPVSRLVSED